MLAGMMGLESARRSGPRGRSRSERRPDWWRRPWKPSRAARHLARIPGLRRLHRSHLPLASPSLVNLVLNSIAIEYHETLLAAAGFQAEAAKQATMDDDYGQYVLVVEGSPSATRTASTAPSAASEPRHPEGSGGRGRGDHRHRATAPPSAVFPRPSPTRPGPAASRDHHRTSRSSTSPAARPSPRSRRGRSPISSSSARCPDRQPRSVP